MHSMRMIHRDLKPSNVLIDDHDFVSICDFGDVGSYGSDLSNLSNKTKTALKGTEAFMSPEVYLDDYYDYKTDMWNFGMVLYMLCTLKYPFVGEHPVRRLLNANIDREPLESYEPGLIDIIEKCIQVD